MTIQSDIRIQLLTADDSNVLPDTYVDLILSDAKSTTGISDETNIALRFYTVYLISLNWDSLNAIESREGVKYRKPDPEKYLKMYNDELEKQLIGNNQASTALKESTNEGNVISDNGVMEKGDYPTN